MRRILRKLFPEWSRRKQAYREAIASCKAQRVDAHGTQIIHPTNGIMGESFSVSGAWRQAERNLKRTVWHVG